jgi:hypothetical protein
MLFSGSTAEIQRSALEKLKELGWAEEIQKISMNHFLSQSFNQHLAVAQNQKKGLTDESKTLLFPLKALLTYISSLAIYPMAYYQLFGRNEESAFRS